MSKDIRTEIVDILENYCKKHDLAFSWVIEKRVDGSLIVNFKRQDHFTYRITGSEIAAAQGDVKVIADKVIEMVKRMV